MTTIPTDHMDSREIAFLRKRDYQFVRELGEGACGKTLLLKDPEIDELYVCKKYAPQDEAWRTRYFSNFLAEIKVLHRLLHPNVVRLFNYYVYRERAAGYILMEYIDGCDIHQYLKDHPDEAGSIFAQTISGFRKLEESQILHRDIRPSNILVSRDGFVKIIDFGFGKAIENSGDFDKSVSLNWWCDTPNEFSQQKYDFATEVYFVGKLFEAAVRDYGIDGFQHLALLRQMCQKVPDQRIRSFVAVDQVIAGKGLAPEDFTPGEIGVYRRFASEVYNAVTKIEWSAQFMDDAAQMEVQLEQVYRNCLLEEIVPDGFQLVNCFIRGKYFMRQQSISVAALKEFLNLMKSCARVKRILLIANLQTKLGSRPRYSEPLEEDVPF